MSEIKDGKKYTETLKRKERFERDAKKVMNEIKNDKKLGRPLNKERLRHFEISNKMAENAEKELKKLEK